MGYEPENTLSSFNKAVEMGADGIELDVYKSSDNHVIVSHSDALEIEGQRYRITKLTLEDIKQINLPKDQTIPTLGEVFEEMEKKTSGKLLYSIDLKDVRFADLYLDVLKSHDVEQRVFTCLESRLFIKKVWKKEPSCQFVYSTRADEEGELGDLHKIKPEMISVVNMPHYEITERIISAVHEKGLKMFAWDVNDVEDMQKVATWDVDGVYSNYPDTLLEIIKN